MADAWETPRSFLETGFSVFAIAQLIPFSKGARSVLDLLSLRPRRVPLARLDKVSKAVRAWTSHVVVSGNLVTGQNPQSAEAFAEAVVKALA